jgi:hypothetical protein
MVTAMATEAERVAPGAAGLAAAESERVGLDRVESAPVEWAVAESERAGLVPAEVLVEEPAASVLVELGRAALTAQAVATRAAIVRA